MLLRERSSKYAVMVVAVVLGLYAAGWFLLGPASGTLPAFAEPLHKAGILATILATSLAAIYGIYWMAYHRLDRGPQYAITHALTLWRLKQALLDVGAGYVVEQYSGQEKVVVLPKIKVSFGDDLRYGTIEIRNHIKYTTQLEKVNLSSALGRYVLVEQPHLSGDGNWYIYEIEDSSVEWRLVFDDYQAFKSYCRQQEPYTLFVDKRVSLPLCSMLLVGETGSGKTYTLYSLVLQLANWDVAPVLYFADPKGSSLYVMGGRIAPQRNAAKFKDMTELLEQFHAQMELRKEELEKKLEEKLDADYSHWKMKPHILIFDELAVYQGIVNTLDKSTRDRLTSYLHDIVLMGRQLGFFLWSIMQKSDSKTISTAIRDNLPWKVVLGLAANTTYMTTFEHAADLPKQNFGPGEGLYTYSGRTQGPKVISFPTLNFDILAATDEAIKRPPVM